MREKCADFPSSGFERSHEVEDPKTCVAKAATGVKRLALSDCPEGKLEKVKIVKMF